MSRSDEFTPINPKHYRDHPSGVESIDCCEQLGFCLGNAWKYLARLGKKDAWEQDRQKVLWYLNRSLLNVNFLYPPPSDDMPFLRWVQSESDLKSPFYECFFNIANACNDKLTPKQRVEHVHMAIKAVEGLKDPT